MAQVLNQYLSWRFERVHVRGLMSTRGKHDWLAPIRLVICATAILRSRFSSTPSGFVVHLSAGGSFVREGALVLFARALRLPCAIHLHGSQFESFAARWPGLVALVCNSADTIFVLTDATGGIVKRLTSSNRTRPRMVKVSNAVTVPKSVIEKSRVVLFCGEVGRRKGVDVLLDSWASVAESENWTLVIAGPIDMDLSRVRMDGGVSVLGRVSHDRALELQATSAIAVLPSRHEALPMFLIEAMARGCAVIASDVGQVAELVEGTGNLLVEPGDVTGLAAALRTLMDDEDLRSESGAAGRRRVLQRFSEETVRNELENEWLSLVERTSP